MVVSESKTLSKVEEAVRHEQKSSRPGSLSLAYSSGVTASVASLVHIASFTPGTALEARIVFDLEDPKSDHFAAVAICKADRLYAYAATAV